MQEQQEEIQVQEVETQTEPQPASLEAQPLPKKPRNQHLKVEEPKNQQVTGRCTENESFLIKKAVAARKKQLGLTENKPFDAIRLLIDLIKKNNSDFLSSIKTK